MNKVFKYFRGIDYFYMLVCLALISVQVWADLKLPDYMSEITNLVQSGTGTMNEILAAGANMLSLALLSLAMAMIVGYFAAMVAANLSATLRDKVYSKTLDLSPEGLSGFSVPELITRSTNDITQIQLIVAMGLQVFIKAPIKAVWAITKISGKNMTFTYATFFGVVAMLLFFLLILFLVIPRSKKLQYFTDDLNGVAREQLVGLRVIKAYSAEGYQQERFEQSNDNFYKTNLFINRIMGFAQPYISCILSGLTLSFYWIGAFMINAAAGPDKMVIFSDMVVFSSYAIQVIMSFMLMTIILIMLPRASVSAKRIGEVLESPIKIVDGDFTGETEQCGSVEFKNVSFAYPNCEKPSIDGISFSVTKGQTLAIIGATGSGKSTLINLIPRFYDASQGEILIDGLDIKSYNLSTLREKIGYISQRAMLFKGDVRGNVSYAKHDISDQDITIAVDIAGATDFVSKIGLEGAVSQGATNLSGGQKQRLTIARAVAKKPEILIFDDSFSALDYKTDRAVREALSEKTPGTTKIIVAQRVSTIKDADLILVIDQGKIAEKGTHDELMALGGIYSETAEFQNANGGMADE